MPTKKHVADPDIEPEYDFRNSVSNRYADRVLAIGEPVITGDARARAARVAGGTLVVSLVDGRELRVPVRRFPRLAAGSAAQRANLRITEGGRALHWPDLDEDIGVEPLLATAG